MAIEYDKINLGRVKGEKGETGLTGNGISSIATNESSADGGENSVVINMTDGSSKTFVVRNGSKGEKGDQGIQGIQGIQGEHGGVLSESQMNAIYMKKVADSDLNMNGNTIRDCLRIVNKSLTGAYATNTYFVPAYGYADIGASSSDMSDYIKKWILRVRQDFNASAGIYIGNVQPSVTGIMIFHLYTSSLNADTGLPKYCSGLYYSYSDGHFVRFYTVNGIFKMNRVSEFPYGSTTQDNRINSMGSNYIRYENGLQICWGRHDVAGVTSSAYGNIHASSISININFGAVFSSDPSITLSPLHKTNFFVGGVLLNSTTGIRNINIFRGTEFTDQIFSFSYIAIGRWK